MHLEPCRWIEDKDCPDGRFLVPGCWSRALNQEADCHCESDVDIRKRCGQLEIQNRYLERRLKAVGLKVMNQ